MNAPADPASRHAPALAAGHVVAAVSLFIAVYLGAFVAIGYAARRGPYGTYWIALVAAAVATLLTIRVMEHGRWSLGFFVRPLLALREAGLGVAVAAVVIGLCDILIVLTTNTRHIVGNGTMWSELIIVFVPAAVHEELVFRGYVYQRIRASSRPVAIAVTSVAFSLLHGGNSGITAIAFANLLFAGVLLALAFECFQRLWFPIGIHFAWNVLSGPILGYDVSGYSTSRTVLRTVGLAPQWASGGAFGIEGSIWMMPVEIVAIVLLGLFVRRRSGMPV